MDESLLTPLLTHHVRVLSYCLTRAFSHASVKTVSKAPRYFFGDAAADSSDDAHDNEVELLASLQSGDQSAFESIYRRYSKELYRRARRLILNKEDCEEIIQEVFESLWRKRNSAEIRSLRAYLYRAVANKVMDHIRKDYRHKRYVEHFRLFEALYSQGETGNNLSQMIEAGLRQLPERVQMAIRLRLSENLSNDEIAQRMKVTNKTVENYMHQVYAHFRAKFPRIARETS
ncbi:MAG: sigma-70 family RNA polymerase sigma factor [Chryseolinea sp.]